MMYPGATYWEVRAGPQHEFCGSFSSYNHARAYVRDQLFDGVAYTIYKISTSKQGVKGL